MKNKKTKRILEILEILKEAGETNDGQRCMIAPSPEVKLQLKTELNRLKELSRNETLTNLLTSKQTTSVGLNDGLVVPGSTFPLGTSAMSVKARAAKRELLRGVVRVIVVLVEFPDKKLNHTKKHFQDLFFSTGEIKTGSVHEYYKEVSNGHVNIQGEVVGPFTLPMSIKEYANGKSGMGKQLPNARTMALHTAAASDAFVNFAKYDNDKDGYADAFVIIHAGRGAEETSSKNDIWSHKWLLPDEYNADGTMVYAYLTVPEDCKLGVCAHELGHLLFGFPDLYDDDYSSEGVGDWCLMGSGSWNNSGLTPAHPSAWCKLQQEWVSLVNPLKNKSQVKIDAVLNSKKVYRLWKNGTQGKEYFLLENRQQKKFDKHLPGEGLLIWHIDDSIEENNNEQVHYKVALVQADDRKDLEKGNNAGDAADVWPGTTGNKLFNKTSKPGSMSYGKLDSGVQIIIKKKEGDAVIVDLIVEPEKSPVKKKKKAGSHV
jgi:immune inhibitor A